MFPPETPQKAESSRSAKAMDTEDQSLTEDYGDEQVDRRNLKGGVDFFSSLGVEKKKKTKEDMPDPEKVRLILTFLLRRQLTFHLFAVEDQFQGA